MHKFLNTVCCIAMIVAIFSAVSVITVMAVPVQVKICAVAAGVVVSTAILDSYFIG